MNQSSKSQGAEEFGDGGAFPEIHVAQYPLGMGKGRNRSNNNTLPVTVDSQENVVFDSIVRQNENSKKIVYSQHKDSIPKILKNDEDEELEKQETAEETKDEYRPSVFNSGAKERIVKMAEMPVDPLDPPKFKHKRIPMASGSPPVPVMHSPPRPVTVKDKQDWNIPPCISNWKNPKGYTIPLENRLAADGRGLYEVQINDNFANLAEALNAAEEKAREAISMRVRVQKEMVMKEKERKEEKLRALAQKARSEREGLKEREEEEEIEREKIREERGREREKERRLEAMSKTSKITRDRDRDIGDKVALGMASTRGRGGEVMHDQRLFNQEKGMGSGFAADDQYNVYEKGLFTTQPTLSTLYKPKKDNMDDEMYGNADEQIQKESGEDSFGLRQWASDMKKGKKP